MVQIEQTHFTPMVQRIKLKMCSEWLQKVFQKVFKKVFKKVFQKVFKKCFKKCLRACQYS